VAKQADNDVTRELLFEARYKQTDSNYDFYLDLFYSGGHGTRRITFKSGSFHEHSFAWVVKDGVVLFLADDARDRWVPESRTAQEAYQRYLARLITRGVDTDG